MAIKKKLSEISWFDWLVFGVCFLTLVAVVSPRLRQGSMPRRPATPNHTEVAPESHPEKTESPRGQGQRGQGQRGGQGQKNKEQPAS